MDIIDTLQEKVRKNLIDSHVVYKNVNHLYLISRQSQFLGIAEPNISETVLYADVIIYVDTQDRISIQRCKSNDRDWVWKAIIC